MWTSQGQVLTNLFTYGSTKAEKEIPKKMDNLFLHTFSTKGAMKKNNNKKQR